MIVELLLLTAATVFTGLLIKQITKRTDSIIRRNQVKNEHLLFEKELREMAEHEREKEVVPIPEEQVRAGDYMTINAKTGRRTYWREIT